MTVPIPMPLAAPRCSRCEAFASRFLPGRRRTFYCDQHGPTALRDWGRLLPLAQDSAEPVGRTLALTPPLPTRIAALLDRFVDGLREVLQDLPTTATADPEVVAQLRRENAELQARLERAIREARDAEEIANEALALVPPNAEAPEDAEAEAAVTERDFPPPSAAPVPRVAQDAPSFPDPEPPEMPWCQRCGSYHHASAPHIARGKGYRVTAPPPSAPEPVSAAVVTPSVPTVLPLADEPLELLALDVLVKALPFTHPRARGLAVTRRFERDYDSLRTAEKRQVIDLIAKLGTAPDSVRLARLGGPGGGLFSMWASRRLRVIAESTGRSWTLTRVADRHDSTLFKTEG